MGLRNFVVRRTEIQLPGGDSFSVRGLGFSDVTRLVALYAPILTKLFSKVVEDVRLKTLQPEAIGQMVTEVLTETPEIAYMLIEIASDEPGTATTTIPHIGLIAQAEAITAIVELTLLSEAEVKKLVEIITKAASGTAGVLDGLMAARRSVAGSGKSVAQ